MSAAIRTRSITGPDTMYPVGRDAVVDGSRTSIRRACSRGTSASSSRSAPTGASSASYLGSYSDRLWGLVALNPGVYLGLGPCTLQGVAYPVCTTNGNLNQRRVLSLSGENPASARLISNLDSHAAVGYAEVSRPEAVDAAPLSRAA